MTDQTLVLRAALAPTFRATPLGPVFAGTGLAVAVTFVAMVRTTGSLTGAFAAAGLFSAAGVGYVLDDAAAVTLASSPTTLAARRVLRVVLAVTIVTVGWFVIALGVLALRDRDAFPLRDLGLELATLGAVGLATGAVALRRDARQGGPAAATAVLLLPLVVSGLRVRGLQWLPLLVPRTEHHARWAWFLAVAVVLYATASRDAAAR